MNQEIDHTKTDLKRRRIKEDRIVAGIIVLAIISYLCIGSFFHEGIHNPDILIGEWKTSNGEECLIITKIGVHDADKMKIHEFFAYGKGKQIFIDDFSNTVDNPLYQECNGVFEIYPQSRAMSFGVKWEEPVSRMTAFELTGRFQYSLRTCPVKKGAPNPGIRFYKTKE